MAVGANSVRPFLVRQICVIPHMVYVFTNHVGDGVPYILASSSTAAKSLSLFAWKVCKRNNKSGAEFSTPTPLCFMTDFDILLSPLCTA